MRKILVVVPLLLIYACSFEQAKEEAIISEYLDLVGILNESVDDLSSIRASLIKKTSINGEIENSVIEQLSKEDWKSHLELFYESDINKNGLSGAYRIETLQAFDGIEKTIYSSSNTSNFIQSIEASYRDGKLFIIRIRASDNNLVYQAEYEYMLYFNHFKAKRRLDHYTIKGKEKMVFKDPLILEVAADIQMN